MKVCAVADLHGRLPDIPECDVLVIAGDICPDISARFTCFDPELMKLHQMKWLSDEYSEWEYKVPAPYILATPGNHDWVSTFPAHCRSKMFIDERFTICENDSPDGPHKTFWFTPWVQHCGDWNYMANRERRRYYFDNIPQNLDMLVMHSPAFGVGDLTYSNDSAGCQELRDVIQKRQPRYAVFGHIHEGQRYGVINKLGGTTLFHCSMWGDKWKPVVLDI
jgi:Icc-related predicted phosphoesterase